MCSKSKTWDCTAFYFGKIKVLTRNNLFFFRLILEYRISLRTSFKSLTVIQIRKPMVIINTEIDQPYEHDRLTNGQLDAHWCGE